MALQKKTLKKFAAKMAAQMTIRDMEALAQVDRSLNRD